MRILIAEDDPVSRRVLEATLQKWGHAVVATTTGQEAWDAIQQPDAPRLVILDWMMPEMDGPDVCRNLREMDGGEYFYVLMLTAKAEVEDVVEGLDAGADDYIIKPFDKRELRMRVGCGQRIIQLQEQLIAMRDRLAHEAAHDGLTGLTNRVAIFDALDREWARARREQASLAVLMLDIDHFKRVNDEHGHAAGDAILQQTAQRMTHACRAYDTVGRYGGEEFLILLAPPVSTHDAAHLAERIREAIGTTPFVLPDGSDLYVTVSLGVAGSDLVQTAQAEALVQAADEALYASKENGRNCVTVVGQTPVHH